MKDIFEIIFKDNNGEKQSRKEKKEIQNLLAKIREHIKNGEVEKVQSTYGKFCPLYFKYCEIFKDPSLERDYLKTIDIILEKIDKGYFKEKNSK